MATTIELVDELVERFHGWNTDGPHGVLRFLDQAQSILMAQESFQLTMFDMATGKLPVLNTSDGVHEYSLPNDMWRVGGVLMPTGSQVVDYGRTASPATREVVIGGQCYIPVANIRTWDWQSETIPAKVLFTKNPGNGAYFLRAWRRPAPITAVTIQHQIPPPCDILYLLPAAAALIDGVQNGTLIESRRIVEHEIKPKFWSTMNKGEQSEDTTLRDRSF